MIWLWRQEATPSQCARGLAVGVFSGCFPFFGLQTVVSIMLASLLKGNRLLAAVGTWISNPLTYLPLYWFNYKIGSSLYGDGELKQRVSELTINDLWNQGLIFSGKILLGSALVGLVFSSFIGLTTYIIFKVIISKKGSLK